MPEHDITEPLQTPFAHAVMAAIVALLALPLLLQLRRIPARLLVLMATAFVDMIGVLMLVPLMPFYVKRMAGDGLDVLGHHLDIGQLTACVAVSFMLAQLLSAPLWGRLSDRRGRRPALLVALAASACAYLVFGFADSLWLLALSRIVQGAGGGTVGVIQAYVADSVPPAERAKALGWLSAATNLGVAIGPMIGSAASKLGDYDIVPGIVGSKMGHAAPGIVAAVICLLNMGFVAVWLRESNVRHWVAAAGAPIPTPAAPGAAQSVRSNPEPRPPSATSTQPVWVATWNVLAHATAPASRLILTYAIAIGSSQGVNVVLALFLARRFHVTEDTVGYFWTYLGAISVFARSLLLGPLIDRFGEARLSRIGIGTLACGLYGVTFANSLPTLALAIALIPLGTACTFPCVTGLLSRVVGAADRGLYMGLQQTYGGVTRILGPLFFGWAFDGLGIEVPYYFAAAFVLATLPLGFGLHRYAGARQPAKT